MNLLIINNIIAQYVKPLGKILPKEISSCWQINSLKLFPDF